MILAGDVGGSKTNLGLFRPEGGRVTPVVLRTFQNKQYKNLEGILQEFLAKVGDVTAACFGVAGPVIHGEVEITNLSWEVTVASLAAVLQLSPIFLVNDLEANAWGLQLLDNADLLTLNVGQPDDCADAALIAAGTGLGEAVLRGRGRQRMPAPSEAGHTDFAPTDRLQVELLQYLWRKFGQVSVERVLSGPGLFNIYSFLLDSGRCKEKPGIAARMKLEDSSAVISDAALRGECAVCVEALNVFTTVYGAEAGNLALRSLAYAGIYVGGGIAPKIAKKLVDGTFMRAFVRKDRMAHVLSKIPVYIALNPQTALLGAALYAHVKTRENDAKAAASATAEKF